MSFPRERRPKEVDAETQRRSVTGNTPEGGGPVEASSAKPGHAFPGALASACLRLAFKNLSEKKKQRLSNLPGWECGVLAGLRE